MEERKILVTGAAGYIGSVLCRQLLARGFSVRAFDSLKWGGEALYDLVPHEAFEFLRADVRDASAVDRALEGIWGVVHLAAIVGDPACAKYSEEALAVNRDATRALFDRCEQRGIARFVFASTCSNYGKMADADAFVDEESDLRPVSLYAELKVEFEDYLLNSCKGYEMCSTSLRFSTVYGFSPRIRFDLTVNEFTRNLSLGLEQEIWGAQFWRPYSHVEDLARSVVLVLESPEEKVRAEVFNVGDTSENYRKGMIVEEILKVLPDSRIKYVEKAEDPRDYRVNFDKIARELGFRISKRVPEGIREIHKLMCSGILTDPFSSKFRNI